MNAQAKIDIIHEYFDMYPEKKFDRTFVFDMQEKLDEYGKLTPAQERSLENIITKWEII